MGPNKSMHGILLGQTGIHPLPENGIPGGPIVEFDYSETKFWFTLNHVLVYSTPMDFYLFASKWIAD